MKFSSFESCERRYAPLIFDDIMSRLLAIYDDADNDGAIDAGEDVYAAYKYLGAGTIVAEDYGTAQTKLTYLDSGGDVVWLDRFGRVADQVWEHYYLDGSGNEITDGTPDAYAYGYDRAGNRTSRENLTKTDGTLDESYSYDGLDRLTQWDVNSATQQTWSLDGLGNDLSAGTYSAANEETPTSLSSGYDAAGNMTTLPSGQTAVYDAWNRMTEVDDASGIVQKNTYDGTNRRIEVSTDFTGTTPDKVADDYLAGQQVIESDQTAGGVRAGGYQMIWSPRYVDAPILRDTLTTSGTGIVTADRLFYLGDANYNVAGLMKYNSVSGQWEAVEHYSYRPYGTVTVRDAVWVSLTGNVSLYDNTALYTGRELDPATGLMYYRARYYSTDLERFVGRDPLLHKGDSCNLYRYCDNDPTLLFDPTGLKPLNGVSGAYDFYGYGVSGLWQNTTPKTPIKIPVGGTSKDFFLLTQSWDAKGNPETKIVFSQKDDVWLVQAFRRIVATSLGPRIYLANDYLGLIGSWGGSKNHLQEVAAHIAKSGWFIDLNYNDMDWNEPFYYWHHPDNRDPIAGQLDDTPTIGATGNDELVQLAVGAYCILTAKWLGFMQWGFARDNGVDYLLYDKSGSQTPSAGFREAMEMYVKVEQSRGNKMPNYDPQSL